MLLVELVQQMLSEWSLVGLWMGCKRT